jgi:hypothetical protein
MIDNDHRVPVGSTLKGRLCSVPCSVLGPIPPAAGEMALLLIFIHPSCPEPRLLRATTTFWACEHVTAPPPQQPRLCGGYLQIFPLVMIPLAL